MSVRHREPRSDDASDDEHGSSSRGIGGGDDEARDDEQDSYDEDYDTSDSSSSSSGGSEDSGEESSEDSDDEGTCPCCPRCPCCPYPSNSAPYRDPPTLPRRRLRGGSLTAEVTAGESESELRSFYSMERTRRRPRRARADLEGIIDEARAAGTAAARAHFHE
jgi:hypothetical protein